MARQTDSSMRGILLLLAVIAGAGIANIYYNQPLLDALRLEFPGGASWVGLVAAAAQIGFALGMVFLAPLGDRMSRRLLILWQIAALCAALVLAATATTLSVLIIASLLIGVFSTLAQQASPFAAELAPPERRGHAIGMVMSGLVLGILLARTFAGLIGEHLSWRAVFAASIIAMLALAALVATRLPESRPTSNISYGALLKSLWRLVLDWRELRETTLTGAALFAGFSVFWTVLALQLAEPPLLLGPQAAGLFGLIGAAGALAAPMAGRLADKRGPRAVVSFSILLIGAAFVMFGFSGASLIGLVLGVMVLDVGLQCSQVSNQARIFALNPEARSRMNTVYMTAFFVGGAVGSAVGAYVWQRFGWESACFAGGLFSVLAWLSHQRPWQSRS